MVEKKKKTNVLQTVLTVLLVGAAFAIGSMWTELRMLKGGGGQSPTVKEAVPGEENLPEEVTELSEEQWQELLKDPAASKGDVGAAVTIVEFSDYQCPYCAEYAGFDAIPTKPIDEGQTLSQIMRDYVETGKVRYIFRDLALHGETAVRMAEAARCAGDQDNYWGMHDKLFGNQAAFNTGDVNQLTNGYAVELGLDQTQFDSCMSEEKYAEAVSNDLVLAQQIRAKATPTFYVNGTRLLGAQGFEVFQGMIDEVLGE
jgi:protein-disulfide isomerase